MINNISNEIWREIPDKTLYRYNISSYCRIKNINTNNILKISKAYTVTLYCGNKLETKRVNILDMAMEIFKEKKPSIEYVAFFNNGDNTNTNVDNITWKIKCDIDILLDNEIWKQVDNFNNYMISNYSRLKNKTGHILQPNGKQQVTLLKNAESITKQIYEITVMTFIGPKPSDLHTVDHIDRNYNNNHLSNLRWATKKEQSLNRTITNPRGIELNFIRDNKIIFYKSISEASRNLNIAEHLLRSKLRTTDKLEINNGILNIIKDIIKEENTQNIPDWIYRNEAIPSIPIKVSKNGLICINGSWTKGSQVCRKEHGQYLTINIQNNIYRVHILIAATFIGKAPYDEKDKKFIVNHKDLDGLNNNIENLEYLSQKGNCQHAVLAGARKTNAVLEYSLDGLFIQEHISLREAARKCDGYHQDITRCCKDDDGAKKYKDRIWKFKESDNIPIKINPYSKIKTSYIQYDNNNTNNKFDIWFNNKYKKMEDNKLYIPIKDIYKNFISSELYYKGVSIEQFIKILSKEHCTLRDYYQKTYYFIDNNNKNKRISHVMLNYETKL